MKDFIGVYERALRTELCNKVIKEFEQLNSMGLCYNRKNEQGAPKSRKDDLSLSHSTILASQLGSSIEYVIGPVNKAVTNYIETYEVGMFGNLGPGDNYPVASEAVKIQKTEPCQGYHVWHSERSTTPENDRFLAWMLYLNDVEEGGETEFFYYGKRFKPTAGTLLVWPVGFTHAHRGNPPLKSDKYIATGWFRYTK
jgi:hypothetical protein